VCVVIEVVVPVASVPRPLGRVAVDSIGRCKVGVWVVGDLKVGAPEVGNHGGEAQNIPRSRARDASLLDQARVVDRDIVHANRLAKRICVDG